MRAVDQNGILSGKPMAMNVDGEPDLATPNLDKRAENLLSTSDRSFPILEEDMTANEAAATSVYGNSSGSGIGHGNQELHQSVAIPNASLMERTMAHSGVNLGVTQREHGCDHEGGYQEEGDRVFPHLPAFEQQFPGATGVHINSPHSFSPRTPSNTPMVLTTKHTPSQSYSHSNISDNRRARSGSQSNDPVFQLGRTFEHSLELDVKLACLFSPREQLTDTFSIQNVLSFSPPPPPPPSPTLGFRHGNSGHGSNFMNFAEGMSFNGRRTLDLGVGVVGQSQAGN